MQKAVADNNIPGGVVLIGHNGKVVYRKAFGSRSLEPTREPMTVDTIFDLASLTKCIATATSMMKLIEEGRVRLNDPVSAYLPEFAQNGKDHITVRELMTHYSGLRPDLDLKEPGKAATPPSRWPCRKSPPIHPARALSIATSTLKPSASSSKRSQASRSTNSPKRTSSPHSA
jgi:CubicO group peptidase (beta-lactamase class C family)